MHNNIKMIKASAIIIGAIAMLSVSGCKSIEETGKNDTVEITDTEYTGRDFELGCFSAGGGNIYVYAYSPDMSERYIARMPEDGGDLEVLDYQIPEGIDVIGINADSSGECSVLLSTCHQEKVNEELLFFFDFDETYIDRLGPDGEVKNTLDITDEFINTEVVPLFFESDPDGNYYVDYENETLLHFSADNTVERFPYDGMLYDTAVDGDKAYAVYMEYDTEKIILSSIENGNVNEVSELEDIDDIYTHISVVGDDIYLCSRNGIYKLHNNKQKCIYKTDFAQGFTPRILWEDFSTDGDLYMLLQSDGKYIIRHMNL